MSSAFADDSGVSCVTTRHLRVQRCQPAGRRFDLAPSDVGRAVENLPLQVAEVDDVEVDEAERADAGGRQVERRRRTEPAGADADDARLLQLPLTLDADLRNDQVAAVALDFVVELERLATARPPATEGTMLTVSAGPTGVSSRFRCRMSSSLT